ncbi:MAG TPA: hypothetical protein VF748_15065 [Candidatus Acidoferrum sp.]
MAWSLVNHAREETGSGTSATLNYTAAVASGNVVCGIAFINGSNTDNVSSISDSAGNTYTKVNVASSTGGGGTWNTVAFWSNGPLTNGPTSVTVNNGAVSAGNIWIIYGEFSPPGSGTISLDGNNTNNGTGTSVTSGSITTTVNGDLIFAGTFGTSFTTLSVGSGFTVVENDNANFGAEFQTQTSSGAINPSFTNTNAGSQWSANGFALKQVSSTVVETDTYSPPPRTYQPPWNVNKQLYRTTAQDFSSPGVETNPHWRGRTYPLQWNPLQALWRNFDTSTPTAQLSDPVHFVPRTWPVPWTPMPFGRTTAQDFSSFGVETNPHWLAKSWPLQWNLQQSLMRGVNDFPTVTQIETNTHIIPKTWPIAWNISRGLMFTTAQDFSSFGVETNPHWRGYPWPIAWLPLPALNRMPAVDVPPSQPETNTFFKPFTWPAQWNLQASLLRGTPQDFSTLPPTSQAVYARYGAAHGVGMLSAIPGEIPS